MRNWYEEIDKKLLPKQAKLKGYELTGIKTAPFFLLLSGRSGLGKSNALIELLHRQNGSYDKIILCCMNFAADPLYVAMKKKNPHSMDIYEKEVPSVDEYMSDGGNKLFITDDMVGRKEFESSINDWFVRGRKTKGGCSMVYITQSYFDVSRVVRRSLSNLYLFPSSNQRELSMILHDYPFLDSYESVVNRYKHIVKGDGPADFMNISVSNGTACINFELYDHGSEDNNSSRKKNRRH
jgi:hypothetical protein